jgi:hypothetical protein
MPARINTLEKPFYRQRTRLDGRDYVLDFAYNEREERWYLSIADDEEKPIATGIKLIANWSLLYPYRYDERCPTGEITVADRQGDGSPPTLLELGANKRCELLYWTRDELVAIEAKRASE